MLCTQIYYYTTGSKNISQVFVPSTAILNAFMYTSNTLYKKIIDLNLTNLIKFKVWKTDKN